LPLHRSSYILFLSRNERKEMGPLEGVKVIDLSRNSPGRYTSMIMADFGAEVITVETPRTTGTQSFMFTDDTWFRYVGMNCNKKSIAVNLKSPKGQEIAYRLIDDADVLIEGFRPGAAARLGMDYDTLSGRNARLIYCSITGYGWDSPYLNRGAHDINVVALTGILGATGSKDRPPIHVISPQIADMAGGNAQALASILAALYAREKTGKGQFIELSIADGMFFFNWVMNIRYLTSGFVAERSTLPTGSDQAWLNVYRCADGSYIAVSCLEPHAWSNLCRVVGREDFAPLHFAGMEEQQRIYDTFCEIFAAKDRSEWLRLFDEADVAGAPVNTVEEAIRDPHVVHRGLVVETDHPKLGKVKLLKSPFRFSDTPVRPRVRPPLYGEHTVETIKDVMGATEEDIAKLHEEGVIE
jgi:crotonobetainyl-CoA:carnitine CoA-transferase CaiB-like acyl-CoA transferase